MPNVAILIPHKRNRANDRALTIALACLVANTDVDYEILIDSETPACPYAVINRLAWKTTADWLVFSNSDVFFAPGWVEAMLTEAKPDTIATGVLVECGAISVADENVDRNFGRTPDAFNREEFEQWAADQTEIPRGEGWYFPSMHHRETFLARGGFDIHLGAFPQPLDIWYWNKWKADGLRVRRTASYAYHLQNFSSDYDSASRQE